VPTAKEFDEEFPPTHTQPADAFKNQPSFFVD
jgi:hypothetical protein